MRLTKIVGARDWRYAIGELILIVIGVSVALAASSWYDGQQDRKRETYALREIRETLHADRQTLATRRDTTQSRFDELLALLAILESDTPYSDDISQHFRRLNGWRGVRIRSAPFEALKERGLNLITNDSLRFRLISLYEDHFDTLRSSSENQEEFVASHSLPYFLKHFRRTETQDWVPHDYQFIRSEGVVANMARWRAFTIEMFQLPAYERTLESIDEVIRLIDIQIGIED
jgi:hypothetical protein